MGKRKKLTTTLDSELKKKIKLFAVTKKLKDCEVVDLILNREIEPTISRKEKFQVQMDPEKLKKLKSSAIENKIPVSKLLNLYTHSFFKDYEYEKKKGKKRSM